MASVTTTKAINLPKLDLETGNHGLLSGALADVEAAGVEKTIATVAGSPVTQAALAAAVTAHTAGHKPLDEFGKLLTLLAVNEGNPIPAADFAAMRPGLTSTDLENEFDDWLAAGGV